MGRVCYWPLIQVEMYTVFISFLFVLALLTFMFVLSDLTLEFQLYYCQFKEWRFFSCDIKRLQSSKYWKMGFPKRLCSTCPADPKLLQSLEEALSERHLGGGGGQGNGRQAVFFVKASIY